VPKRLKVESCIFTKMYPNALTLCPPRLRTKFEVGPLDRGLEFGGVVFDFISQKQCEKKLTINH